MYEVREDRIGLKQAVTATILGNPDVSVPCQITNFSRTGMCFTLLREISPGAAVKVEWDRHFLVGRVRRVSTEGEEYQVGLELLYCSKWEVAGAETAAPVA
jgi:hypothetical protein